MSDKNNDINEVFDKIRLSDEKKKRIYYDIRRNFDKKGYVSNRKLHFFKQKFDRFVPAIALSLIVLFGFAYYGVATGLFTGRPFVSTDEMLEETGYGGTAAENADGGPAAGGSAQSAEAAPEAAENNQAAKMDFGSGTASTETTVTNANIYASIDVGYTLYVVNNIPQDALVLWQEMESLEVVPAAVTLEAYSITEDTLTLDFNSELQSVQDASATTALITGIAKTYSEFYPETTEMVITSAGEPLTFNGAVAELSADTTLDITDRKEVEYTP